MRSGRIRKHEEPGTAAVRIGFTLMLSYACDPVADDWAQPSGKGMPCILGFLFPDKGERDDERARLGWILSKLVHHDVTIARM